MSDERIRHAECSCGKLKIRCEGEPLRVSICHCHACQRRTGSPFGQQSRWPEDKVKVIEGTPNEWVRIGDEGSTITFRFCGTCGATVFFNIDKMPGFTAVPVGAFADSTFPPPVFSIYQVRKHPWVNTDGIEHMD